MLDIDVAHHAQKHALSTSVTSRLLELVESTLGRDTGPAGFRGTLALGVVPLGGAPDALGVQWMHVVLGSRATRCVHTERLLPGVDAVLALGADDRSWISGDRGLIERFIARYLKPRSGLSLRIDELSRKR